MGQAGHSSSGTIHRYYHYVRRPKDLKVVRSRLNADELEEKVIAELRSALTTQGYFHDLEKILKSQADANDKGGAAEYDRVQKEIKELQNNISLIWTNQSRMQLGEEALKLAGDELNRLAKQKADLEKYFATLDPKASDPYVFKEQALFVENQIRWCMQGWAKANPAMRKRLLRRTIKEIIVTKTELLLTFWTHADGAENETHNDSDNVIAFRRTKSSVKMEKWHAKPSGTVPDSAASTVTENLNFKLASGENRNPSIKS